ncbi:MAG: ATP synthase subunit C [Oscillospiraceae bacterium]|jgi:V/A-type H+-transporting ATPase subunit K|nr:ATP synthase subunit C [Oscillospiraceae bacterium]
MDILLGAAALTLIIVLPLYALSRRRLKGKPVRSGLLLQILCFFAAGFLLVGFGFHQSLAAEAADTAEAAGGITDVAWAMIAAALAVGLSGIGGGIAVAASASAALGAISENEKTFGKALIFVGMAEGVALYGLIIALMIILNS